MRLNIPMSIKVSASAKPSVTETNVNGVTLHTFKAVPDLRGRAVAEAECNTVTGLKQVHHAATPLPLS